MKKFKKLRFAGVCIEVLAMIIWLSSVVCNGQNADWAFGIGGDNTDNAYFMTFDGSENVILTGSFMGENIDFDPGPGEHLMSSTG